MTGRERAPRLVRMKRSCSFLPELRRRSPVSGIAAAFPLDGGDWLGRCRNGSSIPSFQVDIIDNRIVKWSTVRVMSGVMDVAERVLAPAGWEHPAAPLADGRGTLLTVIPARDGRALAIVGYLLPSQHDVPADPAKPAPVRRVGYMYRPPVTG
jgi:hypothetical protein